MAWYATAAAAIADDLKIETQKREGAETMGILTTTDFVGYTRTSVMTQYTLSGLTEAAADAYLTAQVALGNQATKQPIGASGYSVSTVEITVGAWTEDP